MSPQKPKTPSEQTLELAAKIQHYLDKAPAPESATIAYQLLSECAGKLRAVAQVIDTDARRTVHFGAGDTDEHVAEVILDEPLNHDTSAAVLSLIDAGLQGGNEAVVNLVRQIPPHGVQQMLMWLLLQSVHANHQAHAQAREVLGAHCTVCGTEWDKDDLEQARLHSAGTGHHIEPIRGL